MHVCMYFYILVPTFSLGNLGSKLRKETTGQCHSTALALHEINPDLVLGIPSSPLSAEPGLTPEHHWLW